MVKDFKESPAWKLAYDFTLDIYNITKSFPKEEKYAMTSQIRRASMSMALNLAEGHGRRTSRDFLNFVHLSLGSCKETECLLMFARDLKYINETQFTELNKKLTEVGKILTGLRRSIEANEN